MVSDSSVQEVDQVNVIRETVRHIAVGISLIVLASAVLLFSEPTKKKGTLSVALINYTSVPVLEDGQTGMLAGLAEGGFEDGKNIDLQLFNAQGDRPTAILIAKEVVGQDFDAVLTVSTPVLQAVANANIDTQRTHIFTLSTDPWGAGVGIDRDDPTIHPPYMTGYGTLQPVDAVFKMARKANPRLQRVGVAWNPAESNSEASTIMARAVCKELGIDLLEVNVESSSAVLEAAKSLVARDVDAIWAGGDSTVSSAMKVLVDTANQADIPVFTNLPVDVEQGVLFSLGANYSEVGRAAGLLAARILQGESPAEIPVENYAPQQLAVNLVVAPKFTPDWTIPAEWTKRAAMIVDASGVRNRKPALEAESEK